MSIDPLCTGGCSCSTPGGDHRRFHDDLGGALWPCVIEAFWDFQENPVVQKKTQLIWNCEVVQVAPFFWKA